jgi:type II restriction/modification system DNA methylase subunit YeeA
MNLKTFAQLSRRKLMDGVAKKILYWGFDTKGKVVEEPERLQGGYQFRGQLFDDANVVNLWHSLKNNIEKKGIEQVVEEAAYTWFNRLMATQILSKNGFEQDQLSFAEGFDGTPNILQRARQGSLSFLQDVEKMRLKKILNDYNKDKEAFALLITSFCHNNSTLNRIFGKIDDYSEILLPDDILSDDGFLNLLNTSEAISEQEYKKVELIGWLYQFYISEKKDEVFALFKKNKKAEAKDIPAATQIFTPNWIVKYMVENTAGKIWLDHKPGSSLKQNMKYLVSNEDEQPINNSSKLITDVEQLTLIDPACGSGHILVEGFDLIYQMYMEEYYDPEEAVESILKNNLFGLDIDLRAAQLSNFAILLKAAQKYRDVFKKGWMPNVYAMPESQSFSFEEIRDFMAGANEDQINELAKALHIMKDAKNLGSVMKLKLSEQTRQLVESNFKRLQEGNMLDLNLQSIYHNIKEYIPILLLLTQKYSSVVANPPYMGQKSMNTDLKNYVNQHYPISKFDLFAVFMESSLEMNVKGGFMGMINQHSWMFLSSYEKLREYLLANVTISNMLHLGPRTFEELGGEVVQSVAYVFSGFNSSGGVYHRLIEYKDNNSKEKAFLEKKNIFKNVDQSIFYKISKYPISYWTTTSFRELFNRKTLDEVANIKVGLDSGNNKSFLRFWHEPSNKKLNFDGKNGKINEGKWFPYNKGGEFKKWYGNKDYVINWENDGEEVKETKNSNIRSKNLQLKPSLSWSLLSSGNFGVRFYKNGFLFDNNGRSIIFKNESDSEKYFHYLNGLLNAKISYHILSALNPTLAFQVGDVKRIPFVFKSNQQINNISKDAIERSKIDWDSRETSWDFEKSPLLMVNGEWLMVNDGKDSSLGRAYHLWQEQVTNDFFQLHSNEEELNRIFIDIYGLQGELTPEVALKDITILQEELDRNKLEELEPTFREKGKEAIELPISKAEVVKQFVSYLVGIMMGRYRLDKNGLNIAHPNPSKEELASYDYNGHHVEIDDDAIVPLMGNNANFHDDAYYRILNLLDAIWGSDNRTDNINFIQNAINKDLDKFLIKDFYKYHIKMYKKKPIYWLFSSKKGAFQVLVYMHRMNEFTAEKIRANYLMEHIKYLRSEIEMLGANASSLSTQDARKLDLLRKDLNECEEYDMELKNIADLQIKFDLDDGVSENYKLFESVLAKIK